jgi:CheY-like chemotaxis protein
MKTSILVADDDDNDLRMIEMALNEGGRPPAVNYVHDGDEALDYLYARGRYSQGRGEGPALIVLDLHMPRVDGWEVLRQVKADERLKSIPVVIFSSSAREADVRHCYDLGANAYVVKPIEFARFQEAVAAIKVFWTEHNHSLRAGSRNFHSTNSPFA